MTTLVSFLGKGQSKGGYREATYRFDDDESQTSHYFGLTLASKIKPRRLILIGTSGSAWDIFFEGRVASDPLPIMEALESQSVTEDLLQPFARDLSKTIGIPVDCLVIGYCRNEAEQADVLLHLARMLNEGEHITLDVTHSFRHLPMLALVAARYLASIKNVVVDDLYYGALEMTEDGKTPVLKLNGMLRMLEWVEALSGYEQDGNFGRFSNLLEHEGLDSNTASALRVAAYRERVTNSEGAKQALSTAIGSVQATQGPLFELFKDRIDERLAWSRKASRHEREISLAATWLAQGDYLRSAQFLLEGLITQAVWDSGQDHNNFGEREDQRVRLLDEHQDFRLLANLRNAMSHGTRTPHKQVNKILENEATLKSTLAGLLKSLPSTLRQA